MKQVTRIFWLLALTWLLGACGGGGSLQREDTPGTPTTPDPSPTTPAVVLVLHMLNVNGIVESQLSDAAPLMIKATLTSDGEPLAGALITFALSDIGLASFSNDTATALTNADGVAQINLLVGELSGSGIVTASYSNLATGYAGFNSTGAAEPSVLSLDLSASGTLVAYGAPFRIEAKLTDETGAPITNKVVSFEISEPTLAFFDNDTGTALTNDQGIAQISIFLGQSSGSGIITASFEGVSDTIGFESAGSARPSVILLDLSASGTQLADDTPLILEAKVTDETGTPIINEVVLFEISQSGLAVFNNDAGTALTNDQGIAQITVFVGQASGSGSIIVTVKGVTDSIGFQSSGAAQQGAFSLDLFVSTTQLASSGTDVIELIAVLKSEENILLSGIPVTFAADQNASLSVLDPISGDDGTARANLTTRNNPENREIQVSATSGSLSKTLKVKVVGTEVNINGASSVILGDSAPITVVLSDSDGTGIAGQTISIWADKGTLDDEMPVTTNANGQVTVTYNASASGLAVIYASGLNASTNFPIDVQQDDFSFVSLPTTGLLLNNNHDLRLRWFKNAQPFANGSVTVTSSRGVISGGVTGNINTIITDANGIATASIRSEFAGPASISALGRDGTGAQVTARGTIEFVATVVDSIFVDATPDIIGPEGQTATITAVVRDRVGNLIKGKPVNFSILADSTSGSITPNTAITDSNGIASTVYTSSRVSQINGVTIEAQSDGVNAFTELTVGDRAFDISIGTGNTINSPDQSSYLKEFAIFVTDAAGRPIEGASLTSSATPPMLNAFSKGQWVWDENSRIYTQKGATVDPNATPITFDPIAFCPNEDANGNGRLDINFNEDINNDGQLTPGNVAVVSFKDGVTRTDANGQATIEIRYAKQFGGWISVVLGVYGQTAGTESSETQLYALDVAADDLTEESNPPPANPFGVYGNCLPNN